MSNIESKNQEAPKIEIASDTVKTQLASLSLDNAEMQKQLTTLADENKQLKAQNIELASVIENQLKSDKILRIQAASKYDKEALANMSIEQLQAVEETLTHTLGYQPNYKSIRAGSASINPTRLTVGDLYGKTPKEIAAMEGL
jgi:septal ring factor EnvC (AmiA/AmiB activator)